MNGKSIRRQDASGRMPLSICHNGRVLAPVPPYLMSDFGADARPGPALWAHITEVAALHWLSPDDTELLLPCHLHPSSTAVDYLDCEPVDTEES